MAMIGVRRGAIGVIQSQDRFLLIQRAPGVPKPGAWCFPGGHVERGETSRRAVRRELHEELGITVEPETRLGSVRVLDTRHVLAVWRVRHVGGAIAPAVHEISDVRWMTPLEIRMVPLSLASNEEVLRLLGV